MEGVFGKCQELYDGAVEWDFCRGDGFGEGGGGGEGIEILRGQ